MISGIDYGKGNNGSCTITFVSPEYIKELEEENQKLKEDLEDYERIFDIWNKRKLINKFNKEFSKKTVKEERAKGNKIVGAIPDAEYVYKKYYEKVEQLDLYKQALLDIKEYINNLGGKELMCMSNLQICDVLEIVNKTLGSDE